MKTSTIAIVGMAGRFPGARNIDEFWQNLHDGVESIRPLSDAELRAAGASPEELANPDYVKAAAVLDDVDLFDASFFGFSPRDASIMDPQHRHFLECAWEALENAGHPPEYFSGSIGVFAGSGMNAYMVHNLLNNRRLMESAGLFLIRQSGNDKDVLATRASYQLDLRGPSMSVQTACSTSLVAVHLACQSLLNCECDMALAGGVTIEFPHARGYVYREGEILSRDGHCRAFDADSSGTVFSSGVGIVVLRRLEDATLDHDTIHAVILGSAVNNDGQRKVGYLAPSVTGQAEVIAEALAVAGASAESITYVETHGTGTLVGDPIEIKGLTQAFRESTNRKGYCAIGSLKTNVGHLDAAAGVAGLIKTVLALEHRQLPASLNLRAPNPQIDFPSTPFYGNQSLADWTPSGVPRRAGVTSLGIGGTNAHVVLEEAPEPARPENNRPFHLIPLSAKTETALRHVTARLGAHLRDHPRLSLAEVAFTCQVGRKAFGHRRIAVASNTAEAARMLLAAETTRGLSGSVSPSTRSSVVFLFSGQGSQYPNMGADLYASEPVFRGCLDACADQFLPHLGLDLRTILYPTAENSTIAAGQLNRTSITQPALFSLEYSLAQWWIAHGVRPQAMVGHSIGEYVAACIAGVLSFEDAIAVTAVRGRLMEDCAPGSMLAVALPPDQITLSEGLALAACNAPEQCVVSGPMGAIADLEQTLSKQGVICHRLQTSHAFHSSMMDPILESFVAQLRHVELKPPQIPCVSNYTGTWITAAEATDPEYWALHLRNTVRFSNCITELLRQPDRVMLEIGPGQTLASLVKQHAGKSEPASRPKVFSSLRRRDETGHDTAFLLNTLGQLWIGGQTVDWTAFYAGEAVARIPLPTYPFERQRYWIDPDKTDSSQRGELLSPPLASAAARQAETGERQHTGDPDHGSTDGWFYQRHWSPTERPATAIVPPSRWMVFMDSKGLGAQIARRLRGAGHDVVVVTPGGSYERIDRERYTIRPGIRADYDYLLTDLIKRKMTPQKIVHLWSLLAGNPLASLEEKLDLSFYGLMFLAQVIGDQDMTGIDIAVISDRLHSVRGEPVSDPICATLLGPTNVIPKELPGITCRNIDVDLNSAGIAPLAVQILAEQNAPPDGSVVALRSGERWTENLQHVELRADAHHGRIRERGVYLITGGLGDLALVIAGELARQFQARLILIGRTPLPSQEEWTSTLEAGGTPARVKQQLRKLIELQSLGAEILFVAGDVCSRDDVRRATELGLKRFGRINGVIHAAGVVDDGPLQIKSRESATRVLDPKVKGTLVLDSVIRDGTGGAKLEPPLDFFALFSSVSSVTAPAGQVDYCAANAFLDSFAVSQKGAGVIAINWGPWQDVGMAARLSSAHPLLGQRLIDTGLAISYATSLSLEKHWVLAEHRMSAGKAVFPGTGYLEMAAAALTRGLFDGGVAFEDVFFLAPLVADAGATRAARVDLHRAESGTFQFSVRARDGGWIEHASGQIARCEEPPPADGSLDQIAARCRSRVLRFDDTHRTEQEKFFDFGARWRCLKTIHLGENEALAELELPASYADDTSVYNLHPALLDLATGSALYLIKDYGQSRSFYFPIFYKRAIIYRRIPNRFFSHIRSHQQNEAGRDVATFDLTLLDEDGRVLAEIEEFSMRLVRDPRDGLGIEGAHRPPASAWNEPAQDHQSRGIAPALGAKAFTRILSSDGPPGVFVFPDGPPPANIPTKTTGSPTFRKTSPNDRVELVLAEWWQELLGYDHVGLDDDFFELGGHSLIVVRLFSKIKKTYGINFGLSTLFEAHTVRKLAQLIREAGTEDSHKPSSGQPLVAIQAGGSRRPLFVISGIGGNVLQYRTMATYLGEDQPLYGLLPRGLNGGDSYHDRVEDMAAYYLEAIREVQPEGPYRLAGYSFGGTVAYEVAQQFSARGHDVSFLGLFDTIELGYRERVKKSLRFHQRLAVYRKRVKIDFSGENPYGSLLERVRAKSARAVYRLLHRLGRPLPQSGARIEDVNALAGARYQPKPYPGRVTLFRCTTTDPLDGDDDCLGWSELAAGGIDLQHVPSDHSKILREPALKILSEKVKDCLERDSVFADSTTLLAAV
jgi:acyl transferase domain-containing protein